MSINWKIRFKNKTFWLTLIPAAGLFGVALDFGGLKDQLTAIVGSVFALLAIMGVVADPTTVGVTDSIQALGYEEPKDDFSDAKEER